MEGVGFHYLFCLNARTICNRWDVFRDVSVIIYILLLYILLFLFIVAKCIDIKFS
ncbi:ORF 2 [Beet pseudoyellows virus]|uniref:ORF 2 n=1 Tax=Beet pseudoyellows virus TaxID=72750 RepID=Q6VRA7_9CLOS|nr:ORF 2 [Beet pseudoyellows virus]AAQ97374.1 ORF 2 [Beet pseudoyellows virus]UDP24114.1 hypothetical protein [Beet pseudoyellows virus]